MKTEVQLQAYFIKNLRAVGCIVYKFSSPSQRGVPDLLVIPPSGVAEFYEIKSPAGTGRVSALQLRHINLIRKRGAYADIIDTKEKADLVVTRLAKQPATSRGYPLI